ncbi:MAG: 30S ribosomal protein S6 [Candidatus Wallbacteria bacterium]|nr:30S ribosomal protein S6 [Candidatus Wallbacteria bacterium]
MTKYHNYYESLIMMNPTMEAEGYQKLLDKVETIIHEEEGEVCKKDVWGVRRLSYQVKKQDNGYYVLIYFKALPTVQGKLSHFYTVTPDIWRHMTLKLNEQMVADYIPNLPKIPTEHKKVEEKI